MICKVCSYEYPVTLDTGVVCLECKVLDNLKLGEVVGIDLVVEMLPFWLEELIEFRTELADLKRCRD